MNRKLYNVLGLFLDPIFLSKFNFFAFKSSMFMADFTKTNDYKILMEWVKNNPSQVLSPKKARELMEKARK